MKESSGPITDAMEALRCLYDRSLDKYNGPTKHLMPYGVLGPQPRGRIMPEAYRYFPFIEWSWYGGTCNLEWLCAENRPVTPEVADKLIREGWVEEVAVNVCAISLLGIAIYAAWRKKKLEAEIGNGNTQDSE